MTYIFAQTALLPSGWKADVRVVLGADGRIESVQGEAVRGADDQAVPLLLPALSNLHSHTFQRAMAGLAERRGPSGRDSFWTWREIMYRFLDLLDPDDIEAIAAFAFMEMQEAGFSAVAEFHYLNNQPGGAAYADRGELAARIAAAAKTTGIGLTLLPVHYVQGGVDGRPLKGGQLRFANDLDGYGELVARCEAIVGAASTDTGLGLAPHSLRAVPVSDLAEISGWKPDLPLHMHIAEQEAELAETQDVLGARPMEWLLANHDVRQRWCLIHCTHMNLRETAALAGTKAVAGLCPITEANLGDGIFDGDHYLQNGGRLGVGSDSNIAISTIGELRQLDYSQRLRDRARVVLADPGGSAGRKLYDLASSGGAQALGRASGAIEAGNWADLLAIDPARAGLHGLAGDMMLDAYVFAGSQTCVTDLWSAGRHMIRQGRHVARDAIAARYKSRLTSIMDRL
ncbi:formimidoylglutamate deiminase [Aliihoeflea sp. 40Bstr573]|uniref:formimidoylglutamate deiminase n=1 Tax=Aliihoeflea sp. 40Bstr573 TaxID=2696467 RepID=UPI0020958E05|nr:formimidoylglutamate deiminase [Aliihoeflea sp. 40Bstr573]MCO6387294.1 formimidoylglutamate deiminase [Aliihoeflea sp. 40Bstr573]